LSKNTKSKHFPTNRKICQKIQNPNIFLQTEICQKIQNPNIFHPTAKKLGFLKKKQNHPPWPND
jgi:hypothetical protein